MFGSISVYGKKDTHGWWLQFYPLDSFPLWCCTLHLTDHVHATTSGSGWFQERTLEGPNTEIWGRHVLVPGTWYQLSESKTGPYRGTSTLWFYKQGSGNNYDCTVTGNQKSRLFRASITSISAIWVSNNWNSDVERFPIEPGLAKT